MAQRKSFLPDTTYGDQAEKIKSLPTATENNDNDAAINTARAAKSLKEAGDNASQMPGGVSFVAWEHKLTPAKGDHGIDSVSKATLVIEDKKMTSLETLHQFNNDTGTEVIKIDPVTGSVQRFKGESIEKYKVGLVGQDSRLFKGVAMIAEKEGLEGRVTNYVRPATPTGGK
jgi:hypothetical protein